MDTSDISGLTHLYWIVADPVAHVRTPQRFNQLLAQSGHDGVMVAAHVAPADLASLFQAARTLRNLHGMVVTVPHKEHAAALCDTLSPTASFIQAANVIRVRDSRLEGTNLDGQGMVTGLRQAGFDPAGRHVYLAGLGGAGMAIAAALAEAAPASLQLYNRTPAKAADCVARLRQRHPQLDIRQADAHPAQCDIAINATTLGLNDTDPLPFSLDRLQQGTVVADAVMSRVDTPLLRAAAARGCQAHAGHHMLAGQLTEIARFLGVDVP